MSDLVERLRRIESERLPDIIEDLRDIIAALNAQPVGLDEVQRLRQQNHDSAVARDREMAELRRQVALHDNALARAKELVRGSPVDWTNDPPSREPDGWWKYTSQNNRDIITAAVRAALDAQPVGLDVERLAKAMSIDHQTAQNHGQCTWNSDHRDRALSLAAEYESLRDG